MRFIRRTLMGVVMLLLISSNLGGQEAETPDGLLLVANKSDQALGIIDLRQGKQIATVRETDYTGHEVAASPDGKRAFVPIFGDSGVGRPGTDGRLIDVIDLASKKIIDTLDLGRPSRPHHAVFGPQDGLLYVTTERTESVTVIDPDRLKVIREIPTGSSQSHMLAISPDNRRGYTANVRPGSVSVLDLEKGVLAKVIPVTNVIQRISVSNDGNQVFTADQEKPRLAVIDTRSMEVEQWLDLPVVAFGTASTLDGRFLLITQPRADEVAVLDLATMTLEHSISVADNPQEIVVHPSGHFAYVSCMSSGEVAEIDLRQWKTSRIIKAGKAADGLAWAKGE